MCHSIDLAGRTVAGNSRPALTTTIMKGSKMAISHPIPIDVLRQLLRLDRETGKLYWLPRGPEVFASTRQYNAFATRFANKEAFKTRSGKYRSGTLLGYPYPAHRVVFALEHGRWPIGVDHRDNDGLNNRPGNLREASQDRNGQNVGSKGGSSQFCGVSWATRRSHWIVSCADATGRTRYLGSFSDETEAARAYDRAAEQWHGEFARLNFPEEG